MNDGPVLPQWAPRVKQSLIQRLYESDASGMLDETLLDEAGWALRHRCQSFIEANAAVRGVVCCPACGAQVSRHSGKDEILTCACGWSLPWVDYFATIQHRQLSGAEPVLAAFQTYVDAFPRAATAREKMLLIDGLIHAFHWNLFHGAMLGTRACAVNLIEGRLGEVVRFLDRLSAGPSSTPGVVEQREAWRNVFNETAGVWGHDRLGD